jgi:hypothetical protein
MVHARRGDDFVEAGCIVSIQARLVGSDQSWFMLLDALPLLWEDRSFIPMSLLPVHT